VATKRSQPRHADAIEIEVFKHLYLSIAEEMGITLCRTSFSPNIKERRDYSCALFLGDGRMLAQAAHIPVHLGAMPASVQAALEHTAPFAPGDLIALNDPYLGGTHLPDITLVSPVFIDDEAKFFVASRAHHADVGGMSPGSMPLSTELYQEGIIIPPIKLVEAGHLNQAALALIVRNSRTPDERRGDLAAQRAAHTVGERRLMEIIARYGLAEVIERAEALIDYAVRLTRALIHDLPDGSYTFADALDGDGINPEPVPILVHIDIDGGEITVDFTGSAPAVAGSVNAVRAIVQSAVGYVIRCIAGESLPMNSGIFKPINLIVPQGSVLDPFPPHAVAGGNVETSQRVVDVLYGALAQALPHLIPAASQGTMNNLTFGGIHPATGKAFAYYETMGGGSGAGPTRDGASGIHCHMSNTLNTPVEALEMALPVRVRRYAIRRGAGGAGKQQGGAGLEREITFLTPAKATLLTDRRIIPPYGLNGGHPGACGLNRIEKADGSVHDPGGKSAFSVEPGDTIIIHTPGGGGWGKHNKSDTLY
jgi:N-methylhydantoinase B/oxoprolinase/acetone carboxylase alpha subunit